MIIFLTALWLGILTSISPCPLAANIAAVSFLSKRINHPQAVFFAGLAYTFGRAASYLVLGAMIIYSFVSIPVVAHFLQKYMNRILGPILVLTGLFLLEAIKMNVSGFVLSYKKQKAFADFGMPGAFMLGIIFALSFCPVSAALFFGSLIPLALKSRAGIVLPIFYGIGTGLPVLMFSVGIALGVAGASRWFHRMIVFEGYARKGTGIILITIGVYYIWGYIIKDIFL